MLLMLMNRYQRPVRHKIMGFLFCELRLDKLVQALCRSYKMTLRGMRRREDLRWWAWLLFFVSGLRIFILNGF